MIHSLSGGVLKEEEICDFAKVQTEEGNFWYKSNIIGLKEGDKVNVSLGLDNKIIKGIVLLVVRNVTSKNSPVPFKRTKEIIEILN